jgi:hypothetical protein
MKKTIKTSNTNLRKYLESLNTLESQNLFNNNNHQFIKNSIPKNIYTFLEYSFLSLFNLISKPLIEITPDKIVLIIFCFRLNSDSLDKTKLKIISLILRDLFKKPVELEIIRLHYPFYETNIFVNLLSKAINKIKIKRVLSKFLKKANIFDPNKLIGKKINKIPSFISGIKIRIAGRLMTQRIIPRKTVKIISKGSLARGKVICLEKGRFTNKNKRGAYNITVTIGHLKNNPL